MISGIDEAAAIAANPDTQNWQYTNISLKTARAPGASPYHDVGAYIKSSETSGGTLTIDPDRNVATANLTRTNAIGTGWDGITDDDKKTYTVSNNQIFYGANALTFDAAPVEVIIGGGVFVLASAQLKP